MKRHTVIIHAVRFIAAGWLLLMLGTVLSAHRALAQTEKQSQKAGPSAASESEFTPLFNGKDLAGWKVVNCSKDDWKVQDGILRTDGKGGRGGWLASEQEFSDFELRLECRLSKNADSGVTFRASPDISAALEMQILDDDSSPNVRLDNRNASLYAVAARSESAAKPVGEWNKYAIIAQGRRVRVMLNDRIVVDADLADYSQNANRGISRQKGVFGLQTLRGPVEFRNIAVRALPAADVAGDTAGTGPNSRNALERSGTNSAAENSSPARPGPADQPHLVLNSGGHTSQVLRVLFTADDQRVISVSSDKTIRVWDVDSGETTAVLRPPIGSGIAGELSAAALSHDARRLAVGGATRGVATGTAAIYLIDLDSGRIEKTMEGHLRGITSVAFAADGGRLASGSYDRTLRIWNVETGRCEQVSPRQAGSVLEVAFSPDDKLLATGSADGSVALWSATESTKIHESKEHSGMVSRMAWSPDGKLLATAGTDHWLCLWNADGSLRHKEKFPHEIWSLAFTRDSSRLLVGPARTGQMRVAQHHCLWIDLATFERQTACSAHGGNVSSMAISHDGKLAVTGSNLGDDLFLWHTSDGSVVHRLGGAARESWASAWGRDDRTIAWGQKAVAGKNGITYPLELAFSLKQLDFARIDGSFQPGVFKQGNLSLSISKDGLTLEAQRDGKLLSTWTTPGSSENRIGCARLLDAEHALVGTNSGWLYLVDLTQGQRLAAYTGHLNSVHSVAPTADRRYFLSTSSDQTLRIWSREISKNIAAETVGIGIAIERHGEDIVVSAMTVGGPAARDGRIKPGDVVLAIGEKDGELTELRRDPYSLNTLLAGRPGTFVRLKLLSRDAKEPRLVDLERKYVVDPIPEGQPLLSLFFENNEWIAWTEEGYYACSAGGERLMGWQVNNGLTEMATFHPASRFHKAFFRPDVIQRLLDAGSVEKALALADADRREKTTAYDLSQALPPKVAITAPAKSGQKIEQTSFSVEARAVGAGNRPVVSLRLLVDGRPYQGDAGLKKFGNPKPGEVRDGWKVELTAGRHRLAVIAASAVSQTVSDEIDVVIAVPASAPAKPAASSLHLVSVGINSYPGRMKLDCAAPDAQAIEQAFRAHSNGLYLVQTSLLLNDRATRKGIIQSLDELAKKAKSGDVAVVFYAGHGDCKIAGQFYLLPSDVNLGKLNESGVSGEELRARLAKLPCTVLLVMDCCYAGSFDASKKKRALPNEAGDLVRELVSDDQGLVVMCGASKEQESGEETKLGHGYFTQALIEGLAGKAASRRDGLVYLSGLQNYVEERVRELSHDEQYPTIGKPTLIRSFPLSKPKLP